MRGSWSSQLIARPRTRQLLWIAVAFVMAATWAVVGSVLVNPGQAESPQSSGSAPAPAAANNYQFSAGFSNAQGRGQWYYQQWDGARYTDMTWDAAHQWWQGTCQYCIISRDWSHPGVDDAVIAWKAPRAGRVAIIGTMHHLNDDPAGDGVRTVIRKQTGASVTKIWPSADYQEIKPNFVAQHILMADVRAGDIIYFDINKASSANDDTLSWDPEIRYNFEPQFTLDQADLVMTPDDFQRVGITIAQDASLSIVPHGTDFDFYHSADAGSAIQKFRGELDRPAEVSVYNDDRFTNPHGIGGDWWIENIYRTPDGHLLAFCHVEDADVQTTGWWAIGLAYSVDDGNSFQILGEVVTQHVKDAGANHNIYGVPYVVKDGYFYAYYGESQPSVARAPVAEVIAAAANGTVSPWRKYHQGNWDQDALGGSATTIIPGSADSYATHGDAAYSTYLGKYLLAGYGTGTRRGVYLTFADDAVCYEVPSWIQSTSDRDTLSPYETIVNVDGSDNAVVGQSFYVYYGYRFKVLGMTGDAIKSAWRWLYRQKVTLNRAGFASSSRGTCGGTAD